MNKEYFVVVINGLESYVVHREDRKEGTEYPFVQVYGPMDRKEAEDLAFKVDLEADRWEQA